MRPFHEVEWSIGNEKRIEIDMIDTSTQKPLHVSTGGNTGPYIMVPVAQVQDVRSLLDGEGIPYWVDEVAISLDGKPEVTVVNLSRDADATAIQSLLDSAA